ncbi:MAG: sugar transferase [Nitrospirae bacterium]|nr:sugar transferase [Nitrospirota bacterium]
MLKRLFDFILSSIGIIGSFPLWLIFSLAIKLEDRGPIFYTQSRVGKGGRIFQVYRRWEVGSRKADRLSY